jgi:hypothetical protein
MSDLWKKKKTADTRFWGGSTSGAEPNMRQELIDTLEGDYPEIAKGAPHLHRKMRLDSDGKLIACPCVDKVTGEPDKDRFCPICFGEGWMWDEVRLDVYRVLRDSDADNATRDKLIGPGLINAPLVVFYTRYDTAITKDDKIVEIKLTDAGGEATPLERTGVYRVSVAWKYRADDGKLEYLKLFTHQEDVKYLNAPSFGDLT